MKLIMFLLYNGCKKTMYRYSLYICVVLMSETLIDIFDYLAWQMQKAALSEEREKERKESNRS